MLNIKLLRKRLASWWGIPLFLGMTLIPLSSCLSPTFVLDGNVYLMFLSMAVCLVLLMLYDITALPGIFVGLLIYYSSWLEFDSVLVISTWYLFSLLVCWFGYRMQMRRRWSSYHGILRLTKVRAFWLIIVLPVFFVSGVQVSVDFELLPPKLGLLPGQGFSLRALLNYQGVLLACIAAVPPIYYLVRIALRPRFFFILIEWMKREFTLSVTKTELAIWFLALSVLVKLLTYEYDDQNILLSNYPLSLLLPVMLYGAMRFGFILVGIVWTITLWVLLTNYPGLLYSDNLYQSLTFSISLLTVFTITIILVATISSRQRIIHRKTRYSALVDPVTGLPNLRWLTRDLALHEESVICFIRMANLDVLSRAYGIQWRIEFKQNIAEVLQPILGDDERLYQLPEYDLVIRLNPEASEQTLIAVEQKLRQFRLRWNGMPIHPHYGLGYSSVKSPVKHLNSLLGELSTIAEESLSKGIPQGAHLNYEQLQLHIQSKVVLLQKVQHALDDDNFVLMVQPIVGFRGDRYYEVLCRLVGETGELISPNEFLPIVHEFGLSYDLDIWVLKKTMQFMDEHRERLPSLRLAVNLSPESICRPSLLNDVTLLMANYRIESYQLVLEVTESHLLQDSSQALLTLVQLRNWGCRIAIDDFGTGYASYNRLKAFQADILKIDGSFITHLLDSKVDYHIVESMCQVARLKNMTVVAEFVETEEQKAALKKLGVDYLQGYLTGRPQRLSEL